MKAIAVAFVAVLTSAQSSLTERITAASLRGRVSFLASNLLEGRDTPSRGLDIAADYLESEFRRANLESPPGGEYAQVANFVEIIDHPETAQFSISGTGEPAHPVLGERIDVESSHAVHLANEPVFKWAPGVQIEGTLAGKILMLRMPSERNTVAKLALANPAAIVLLARDMPKQRNIPRLLQADNDAGSGEVILTVPAADVEGAFDRLSTGMTSARASIQVGSPTVRPAQLHNVVGILRGSDPKLREQCIVISAHYDHLGTALEGKDRIFNGANDDASGVATVVELAEAFGRESPRPARTLVFLCFFGEERGLLGSRWYVTHPVFPLNRTVADINFEQLGEPDPDDGLPEGSLGVTGYAVSDLPGMLAPTLEDAGVTLRDVRHNDEYFERSDNLSFARAGIPAHTFAAALDYPEYHTVADEWPRLNFQNMAKLDRALALAILHLANDAETPRWTSGNRKAKEYLSAWQKLHP